VLSDTVGFVRQLPHQLVEAFAATLEETAQSDLLLHVVDASAPDRDDQIEAVSKVLAEIGASDVPQILVYNKVDLSGHDAGRAIDPCGSIPSVFVSATSGAGLDTLRGAILDHLRRWRQVREHDHGGPQSAETSNS
jgi:GTPase